MSIDVWSHYSDNILMQGEIPHKGTNLVMSHYVSASDMNAIFYCIQISIKIKYVRKYSVTQLIKASHLPNTVNAETSTNECSTYDAIFPLSSKMQN